MSGCGSSRLVPAARRKAWVSIKHPAPCKGCWNGTKPGRGRGQGQGRGRAGHGAKARGQEAKGARGTFRFWLFVFLLLESGRFPPRPDRETHAHVPAWGCLTAVRQFAGRRDYSPRLPGGFTLPHRADGRLGRGPRSEPRAPMQMVSGALGSLGFRVEGLGFRVCVGCPF